MRVDMYESLGRIAQRINEDYDLGLRYDPLFNRASFNPSWNARKKATEVDFNLQNVPKKVTQYTDGEVCVGVYKKKGIICLLPPWVPDYKYIEHAIFMLAKNYPEILRPDLKFRIIPKDSVSPVFLSAEENEERPWSVKSEWGFAPKMFDEAVYPVVFRMLNRGIKAGYGKKTHTLVMTEVYNV